MKLFSPGQWRSPASSPSRRSSQDPPPSLLPLQAPPPPSSTQAQAPGLTSSIPLTVVMHPLPSTPLGHSGVGSTVASDVSSSSSSHTGRSTPPPPLLNNIRANDPKAFKGEAALTRYLHAMDQEVAGSTQTGGLLADPTQATSASHTQIPTIRYSNEMAKQHFSFLRIIFCGRNEMGAFWFIKKIFPQLVVGILLNLVVELCDIKQTGWWAIRSDTQRLHGFVGTVLAFVLVFRSNASYDRYYEARKTLGVIINQCREAILETCSMFAPNGDAEHNNLYRNEIRRKLMVMVAFIRQNIRESHVGFMPNSSEGKTPFHEGTNFIRDPTRPRLCDLLTPAEVEAYGKVQPSARAACVASEIKGIAQLLARNLEYSISYYSKVSQCLQVCLDAQETLYRIVTTPVPYPYSWILNVMLVVFIYSVPFLYDSYRGGSYFGTTILVLAYFGCQRIAEQCENPLEWDACDLDVEVLTMWIHDETRDISNFTHSQNMGFIPSNIRHAPMSVPTAPAAGLCPTASLSPKAESSAPTKPGSPRIEASGSPKAAAAAPSSSMPAAAN